MVIARLEIERRAIPAFLCLVLSFCLVGCEPVFQVTPASDSEMLPHPAFQVIDPDHPGERPRYHTIKLYSSDGKLLWHLRADPFGDRNSVGKFSYGVAPKGFSQVVAPVPLEPGRSYTLYVMGIPTGSLRFSCDSTGHITGL